MNATLLRSKRTFMILIAALAVVSILVIALSIRYVTVLGVTVKAESERYMDEISRQVSTLVEDRLLTPLTDLQITAQVYASYGNDKAQSEQYLDYIGARYGFQHIGFYTMDALLQVNGRNYENTWEKELLRQGFSGESAIFRGVCPLDGNSALVFAVPAWENGAVNRLLVAVWPIDSLRSLLSIDSFSQAGFTTIVSRTGEFIVASENENAPSEGENFFAYAEKLTGADSDGALAEMKGRMLWGESGFYRYAASDGIERLLNYMPLRVQDWYLLSEVPTSVTQGNTRPLVLLAAGLCSIVAILLVVLLLLFVMLYRRNRRQLEEIAWTDSVTGGPSRNKFELDAAEALKKTPLGTWVLVSMDLQKFKLINDTFGSEEGDRTLRYIYETIRHSLHREELAARISADQFQLLLLNEPQEKLRLRLTELTAKINSFNQKQGKKYYLQFSIGVYVVDQPEQDLITLQDRANVARNEDKQSAQGQTMGCTFYTEVGRRRLLWEKEIDDRLEAALESGEFIIYLQPKVSLEHGRVAGAEALVRWIAPEHGMIQPNEFIPVLERSGAITKIDLYVFELVCKLLRRWLDEGRTPMPVAVNLSRANLWNHGFLSAYATLLSRYQIPPSLIEMELTESLVVDDPQRLCETVDQIHKMGLRCALDDFGAGYSSLNSLKDIQADVLKLDRAFFSATHADGRGQRVVESVISLARSLEMETVAEGVEQAEQIAYLRCAGCDLIQGFYYAPPLPIAQFEQMAFAPDASVPNV